MTDAPSRPRRQRKPKPPIAVIARLSGSQLKTALSELDIKPAVFAKKAGIRRETVYRWLRAKTIPPLVSWLIIVLQERRKAPAADQP